MSRLIRVRRQFGQGMSEYLIITGLIAVASIGVVGSMGGAVTNNIAAMAMELGGVDGSTEQAAAAEAGQAAGPMVNGMDDEGTKLSDFADWQDD